jgi:hypothetical protein
MQLTGLLVDRASGSMRRDLRQWGPPVNVFPGQPGVPWPFQQVPTH